MLTSTLIRLPFLVLIGVFGLSATAQAAAITNLSDSVQIIEIYESSGVQTVEIAPWRTWRIVGKATVRYKGREVHIEHDEEYAIWQSGTFGPQARINTSSRKL